MPVMDGVKATELIKQSPEGKATSIIAVSASALEEERIKVLECGADGFIRKPFKENVILEELKNVLNISYIYESEVETDSHSSLSPDLLSVLPADILEKIRKAVQGGYHEELIGLIDQVSSSYPDLSQSLMHLANGYEYDHLLSLLDGTPAASTLMTEGTPSHE
jgi:CheY-like chemotaxis protein